MKNTNESKEQETNYYIINSLTYISMSSLLKIFHFSNGICIIRIQRNNFMVISKYKTSLLKLAIFIIIDSPSDQLFC